jgi:hypothetical protein
MGCVPFRLVEFILYNALCCPKISATNIYGTTDCITCTTDDGSYHILDIRDPTIKVSRTDFGKRVSNDR